MNTFLQMQVQYNQGLLKTFYVGRGVSAGVAMDAIKAFGRFRSIRVQADVDEATARSAASNGSATLVEVRHEKAA